MGQNLLLQRHGHGQPRQRQFAHQGQQVAEGAHLQRQQYSIDVLLAEGGVLHQRRKRVGNRVAGHAEDARRLVKLLHAVKVAQQACRDLSSRRLHSVGRRSKRERGAGSRAKHAAHEPFLAHGDAHYLRGE